MPWIAIFLFTISSLVSQEKFQQSESSWKKILTPEQYGSLREKKQDRAFVNKYALESSPGIYHCAGCKAKLFDAKDKLQSITSYPAFRRPYENESVYYLEDRSLGFKRYEVLCRQCNGHLGHIFKDINIEEYVYCINSSSLILNF